MVGTSLVVQWLTIPQPWAPVSCIQPGLMICFTLDSILVSMLEVGGGTHVNPWLIHVNVWQKPLQYCKVISLQLIKINGKKKRIHLPIQGTQVWPPVWEDSICHGAANNWTHKPQLLKPTHLQQEKPPQWEAHTSQLESSLFSLQIE